MTTGYWLLPEDSPCEFHNSQWNHSFSLNSCIQSKTVGLKPWALINETGGRRALSTENISKPAPTLRGQRRKSIPLDHGSFGYGCGVRSTDVVPPRNYKFFAQPIPQQYEKQAESKRELRWQREHLILTSKHLPGRAPLPDKGKPAVRRGRKATDQISDLRAGLPEEE